MMLNGTASSYSGDACCNVPQFCRSSNEDNDRNGLGVPIVEAPRPSAGLDEESSLVKDLNALSVQEREEVFDELHGVAKVKEENPEFLAAAYTSFDEKIAELSRGSRKALDRAFFLRPSLARDREFHLMFLRADKFDSLYAARRMAQYYTSKLTLFGEAKLVRKITLDDLMENPDDAEVLRSASFQFLSEKDRTGRTVWFVAGRQIPCKNWKSSTRFFWYQIMAMLEEESAQIHGMVDISYFFGSAENFEFNNMFDFARNGEPILTSLPFRFNGLHFCFDDSKFKGVFSFIQLCLAKQNRIRIRSHFGSPIEVQYSLMTFGIPTNCWPVNEDGSLNMSVYEAYLERRRKIEQENKQKEEQLEAKTGIKKYPNQNDVIVGRGRPYQDFNGNLQLLHVVDSFREQYHQSVERYGKLCIVMDIIKNIHQKGGKFLQRTPDGWKDASENAIREKIRSSLRKRGSTAKELYSTDNPVMPINSGMATFAESDVPNTNIGSVTSYDYQALPTLLQLNDTQSSAFTSQYNDAMSAPNKKARIMGSLQF